MPYPHRHFPRPRDFVCKDCGGSPDCPMLEDDVWLSVAGGKDLLCTHCTERRLGRKITMKDLRLCVANYFTFIHDERVKAAHKELPENIKAILEESFTSYLDEYLDDIADRGGATIKILEVRKTAEWLNLDFDRLLKTRTVTELEWERYLFLEKEATLSLKKEET